LGGILDALENFFVAEDWTVSKFEEESYLKMGFKGKNGQWNLYAQAIEVPGQCIFYSVCPAKVPEDRRKDMAQLLTFVNYSLILGNFEMDLGDGEIRYKTSLDVRNAELTPELIEPLVYTNVAVMDEHLPDIMSVATGMLSVEQTIERMQEKG
jgi:hypothetical protein